MRTKAAAVLVGLLFAACGQLVALREASWGAQWATPAHYSWIMFLAYPFALWRVFDKERASIAPEVALLAGAAIANLLVLRAAFSVDAFYDSASPAMLWSMLWLVFWLFWQALPIWAIANRPGRALGSTSSLVRKAGLVLLGLLLAAAAELMGAILAWGGEGWNGPVLASFILFIGYPVALLRVLDRRSESIGGDLILVALALLADVCLLWDGLYVEYRYFRRGLDVHPVVDIWLALWLAWHVLPILTIALKFRRAGADGEGNDAGR